MRLPSALAILGASILVGAPAANALTPTDPLYAEAIAPGGFLATIRWDPARLVTDGTGPGAGVPIVLVDSGVVTRDAEGVVGEYAGADGLEPESGSCAPSRFAPLDLAVDPGGGVLDDPVGHGTTVASLAAGRVNGRFAVGVAPDAPLVVLATGDPDSRRLEDAVPCALPRAARYLAGSGIGVVNMSMDLALAPARAAALLAPVVRAGGLVVAAAGNLAGARVAVPARTTHTLAVRAIDAGAAPSGAPVDVLAPGSGGGVHVIDAAGHDTGVEPQATSSWATGVASGAAAYVWSITGGSAQQVAWRLRVSAGRPGVKAGTIDLRKALAARVPEDDEREPNDTAVLAATTYSLPFDAGTPWSGSCSASSCPRFSGIASANDDPVDVWVVRTPRRSLCATVTQDRRGGLAGVSIERERRRPGVPARAFRVTVRAKARLVGYTVRPSLCSGKPRVTLALGTRGG